MTEASCKRNWVDEEHRDWRIYTVEKWLRVLLLPLNVTVSGSHAEKLYFLVPFYLLSRPIGGYHTRSQTVYFY